MFKLFLQQKKSTVVIRDFLYVGEHVNRGVDRSYRSDDTEDAVTTDNPTTPFPTPPPTLVSPRSPLPHHRQASPFPLENTNSRRIHYATPQDRLRGNNGEVIYASNKKCVPNNTLSRSNRGRHGRTGGMTSSSSATSCNSCTDGGRNDVTYHGDPQRLCLNNAEGEESPPEPAPPEVPPRGPSLHSATLRRRAEYSLPVGEPTPNGQESQFLSQGVRCDENIHLTGNSSNYKIAELTSLVKMAFNMQQQFIIKAWAIMYENDREGYFRS
ncbi:hypothetical protein FQA39_LY06000 [Lamprigera yunnana]|nr:hypothetical protein FQA39_LY06000 [Lamprigera yunnana]